MGAARKYDHDKARAMVRDGMPIAEVARQMGCSRQAISAMLGGDKTPRRHRFDHEAALDLYAGGATVNDLAIRFDVSPPTIYRVLDIASKAGDVRGQAQFRRNVKRPYIADAAEDLGWTEIDLHKRLLDVIEQHRLVDELLMRDERDAR